MMKKCLWSGDGSLICCRHEMAPTWRITACRSIYAAKRALRSDDVGHAGPFSHSERRRRALAGGLQR